ncbi:hypothetical protein ABZ553_14245 [Streptomyces sparsogenes]
MTERFPDFEAKGEFQPAAGGDILEFKRNSNNWFPGTWNSCHAW